MYESYEELPKIKLPNASEIKLSDSTLRDGVQMPGVFLKREHNLKIYEYLHRIGIEKTEVFLYRDRHKKVAKELLSYGYEKPEVTGWSRANPKDIDEVLKVDGIKETGILMSVSDVHLFSKIGFKSREEAEERYLNALQYAVDHGLRVRCHLEDTTRADIDGFVIPLVKKILEIAPNAIIRICDTLNFGIPFESDLLPYSIGAIVRRLKEVGVREIETHVHDDFGLGVAVSLAGFWYGANWSNLTFLGIGERAGNSELEKVLVFLVTRVEGMENRYDLSCLTEFARYMENEGIIRVPRNKAVVGENVFAHESGIHTAGVLKNPFTYEPFPPELVGGSRKLLVGCSSGTEVVRYKVEEILKKVLRLNSISVPKNDERVVRLWEEIQRLYDEERRESCISDEEMEEFVKKHFLEIKSERE